MLYYKITENVMEFPAEVFGAISSHAVDLIKQMTKSLPEERLACADACSHPWLVGHEQSKSEVRPFLTCPEYSPWVSSRMRKRLPMDMRMKHVLALCYLVCSPRRYPMPPCLIVAAPSRRGAHPPPSPRHSSK